MKARFTIRKYMGDDRYSWAVFHAGSTRPIVTGLGRDEARHERDRLEARAASIAAPACGCRAPKRHRSCAYCGCGNEFAPGERICGVCAEAGIDGDTINGTTRVSCPRHGGK